MTKRQLKKEIYTSIVKEGKTHQETFDKLRFEKGLGLEFIAEEVAKIPSKFKSEKYKNLIYIYIGALVLAVIIRLLTVFAISNTLSLGSPIIFLLLIVVLIVPAFGIYAALTSRIDGYKSVGMLLILSILRSLKELGNVDLTSYIIGLIPIVVAIILAFYIPTKLKMGYQKSIRKVDENSELKSFWEYHFEVQKNEKFSNLLDDAI
ncbi:MAG: hypothetical protein HYR91_00060 [Flavobacteriia bacterium]|nr:hypothetical protein [Flavobacteriia bacterium]